MAPPEKPFPVSELEQRVNYHTVNFKEKSRKLGDFDLKRDCELYELVQYTCTTVEQQQERLRRGYSRESLMECFPFVRLFRRCGQGDKMFHVETTAWEGEHAWKPPKKGLVLAKEGDSTAISKADNVYATYGSYFWSNK